MVQRKLRKIKEDAGAWGRHDDVLRSHMEWRPYERKSGGHGGFSKGKEKDPIRTALKGLASQEDKKTKIVSQPYEN